MEDWEKRQNKFIQILDMPEYKLRQRTRLFDNSIYIFQANFADLEKLLSAVARSQGAVGEYTQSDGSIISEPFREILRLLHNYFAAAKTLVDHSRKFYKEIYADNNTFPDYNERVKTDFDDHLSCFVQDLRNYYQHYKLPAVLVYHPLIVADGCQAKNSIVIRPSDLAKYEWKAKAKEFIDAHERELVPIDLLWVSTQYRNKVTEFYEWFQQRQNEIHTEEFARLEQAENELKQLL